MSVSFQIDDNVIQEMVETIVEEAQPLRIILFGSYARGDTVSDSDVDFLVVERGPFGQGRSRRKEATKLWKALARFRCPKDILVFSQDEVETWREFPNDIIALALRKGKVVYERV